MQLMSEADSPVACYDSAISSHLDAIDTCIGYLLAQNQACQDASDGVKLCGVDEWVGADIEKL